MENLTKKPESSISQRPRARGFVRLRFLFDRSLDLFPIFHPIGLSQDRVDPLVQFGRQIDNWRLGYNGCAHGVFLCYRQFFTEIQ